MINKRGSSPVFLMIILSTLITISLTLVLSVKSESGVSRADGVISLAGDSLLSEFNYYVEKEYGLFILKGTDKELTSTANRYVNYSLSSDKDVTISDLSATGVHYSVSDIDLIHNQLIKHSKFAISSGIIKGINSSNALVNSENKMSEHTLRHGPTISSLPSNSVPGEAFFDKAKAFGEGLKNSEAIFNNTGNKYLIDSYIFCTFNDSYNEVNSNHFFKDEVEYIVAGKKSDADNVKKIRQYIKVIRVPLNLAYLYTDPEKVSILSAAAEALTPGPAAIVTQATLASTWAYAEADNDVKLLLNGYKVPITKTSASWATDFDTLSELIDSDYIKPAVNTGLNYRGYLRLLLFIQDETVKTARIMDLIQINMRKQYDRNFLMNEYYTGVSISATVNGKELKYEKTY